MSELRFSDAQYALDIPADNLRNWLKLGKVTIETPYGGGWSTFTLNDIYHIALVRIFVDLGRRIEHANQLAQIAAELVGSRPDDPDPAARWSGNLLSVIRERTATGEKWTLGKTKPMMMTGAPLFIDVEHEIKPVIERAISRIEERQGKAA